MTHADILGLTLLGAAALCTAPIVVYVLADAVRGAWRLLRAADNDRPAKAPHRCPVCYDIAADEANGVIRTDFELWESEWTP